MNILLTNDDGIFSEGIRALYESLSQIGKITIVAPDSERSAVGHAITLSDPLRGKKVNRSGKFFGYATTGTPADCVKLAIRAILKKRPDIEWCRASILAQTLATAFFIPGLFQEQPKERF